MPNGGYPLHMVLRPWATADYVVYCRGPVIHLFAAHDWETSKAEAQPVFSLDAGESAALATFVGNWLERAGGEQRAGRRPNIQYEL